METQLVKIHFPNLSKIQKDQFNKLVSIYPSINEKVNLISRKDIENLEVNHILHSTAIQLITPIQPNKTIIDIGTGGGFPGIPLAILNPNSQFVLVDSIAKKINAVQQVIDELKLSNAQAYCERVENINLKFDIAVARAVAPSEKLYGWMKKNWKSKPHFILLKGGNLKEEFAELNARYTRHKIIETNIVEYLNYPFFETKKVITIKK